MKNFYLIILIICSHFTYSDSCENQFLDQLAQDAQNVYHRLQSKHPKTQLEAIQEIRELQPDVGSVVQTIVPLLRSENSPVRLAALRLMGDYTDVFPQFIGIFLWYIKKEPSPLIRKWMDQQLKDIPANVRSGFYQGKTLVDRIHQLSHHLTEMHDWLRTIFGANFVQQSKVIMAIAAEKDEKDRSVLEQEIFKLSVQTATLSVNLRQALLSIDFRTYKDFMFFLSEYVKYSGHDVYMSSEVTAIIQIFYQNYKKHFHDLHSS